MAIDPFGNADYLPGVLFRKGTPEIVQNDQSALRAQIIKKREKGCE
jgi:hypothetical protein